MILSRFPLWSCKQLTVGSWAFISTDLIKKSYQHKSLQAKNDKIFLEYPKTFEQKMLVLNHPKTTEIIEIIQFGVKYKKGKNWIPLLMVALAIFGWLQQRFLPIRINDRYFTVSYQCKKYLSGYFCAAFNYQKPFYLYLPAMLGVYQLSRFVNLSHLGFLILANVIVGDLLATFLVEDRIKKYEMWQNQSICFGEGNLLSVIFAFWSYIGFKQAFTHLKSKIFLKTIPGIGIIRKGLPFGYICIFYAMLQALFYRNGAKNSEVILAEVITGLVIGLIFRRVKPILK